MNTREKEVLFKIKQIVQQNKRTNFFHEKVLELWNEEEFEKWFETALDRVIFIGDKKFIVTHIDPAVQYYFKEVHKVYVKQGLGSYKIKGYFE